MSWTVVLANPLGEGHAIEAEAFEGHDVKFRVGEATTTDGLVDLAAGADAVVNPPYPTTGDAFERLPSLSAVGVCGIGVDHVDVDAATANGVQVINVPDYCVEEVSTHAVALLLSAVRHVPTYDETAREGSWDWDIGKPIRRLRGQTFGFVGFGEIARRVAEKVDGFSFDVVAYDPYLDESTANAYDVRRVSFETLLDEADLVSVNAPLTEETAGLFDRDAFRAMNSDAILVNVSRGAIVDEGALHDAIVADDIAGAGIDVLPEEPPGASPLFDLDDVVVTPHAAWYSEDARREVRRRAAADVRRILEGGQPQNLVNPEAR